ncbi:MAG: hypothetical protein V3S20_08775 [Dehalococcoidia bacterium]
MTTPARCAARQCARPFHPRAEGPSSLGEIEPIDTVVEQLKSVTAEDIQRVAKRILVREKTALSVVGPDLDDDRL